MYFSGPGSPEGKIHAIASALYLQTDGAVGQQLWQKTTYNPLDEATGWALIAQPAGGDAVVAGADNTGATNAEPELQAKLDEFVTEQTAAERTLYLRGGLYRVDRPLRVKMRECEVYGDGESRSVIVPGPNFAYGPLMVVYPKQDKATAALPTYRDIADTLGQSLVTGSSGSFSISLSGTAKRQSLVLTDAWPLMHLDGLAAFCGEFTFQLKSTPPATGTENLTAAMGQFTSSAPHNIAFQLAVKDQKLHGVLTVGATRYQLTGTTTLVSGVKYHAALSYDGSTIRLFLAGTQEASQAATGTVTMDTKQDLTIGDGYSSWPESGIFHNGADALIDGVRFSSVVRYTGNFTPPTAAWALDANTLLILNFDEQYDALTVGRTNDGDAHFFVRRDGDDGDLTDAGFAERVYLHDFSLSGDGIVVGGGGTSPRGKRVGGLMMKSAPACRYERLLIFSNSFGISALHDTFLSKFRDVKCHSLLTESRWGFAHMRAAGATVLDHPHSVGYEYLMMLNNGNFVVNGPFLESSSVVTKTHLLVKGGGGLKAGASIQGGTMNSESGGGVLERNVMIDRADVEMYGAAFEHRAKPAVELDGGRFVGRSCAFHQLGAGPWSEIIKLGDRAPESQLVEERAGEVVRLVDPTRLRAAAPWTNKPQHLALIRHGKTLPVVGGCQVIEQSGGGTVTIDAGQTNVFTIDVLDGTAFTLGSPINGRPGQEISLLVRNRSGGAMGAVTFGFSYAVTGWVEPADGQQRGMRFANNGLGWHLINPVTADIAIPSFVPTDFTGLSLWLDADQIVGLIDNDPVATWADQSGNSNDATAAGAARPAYRTGIVNGKPVVRFDGVANTLAIAADASLDHAAHTIILVGAYDVAPVGGNWGLIHRGSWLAGSPWAVVINQTPRLQSTIFDAAIHQVHHNIISTLAVPAATFQLWETDYNGLLGGTARLFQDGQLGQTIGEINPGTPNPATGVTVGGDASSSSVGFLDGDLAEVIVYDRALNEDERQQIEFYLGQKYNIDVGAGC